MERLVEAVLFTPEAERDPAHIADVCSKLSPNTRFGRTLIAGDYLPARSRLRLLALSLDRMVARMASRNPTLIPADLAGPKITAWMHRMQALPSCKRLGRRTGNRRSESASAGNNLQRLFFVGENADVHTHRRCVA
jgi:hypothetical protein